MAWPATLSNCYLVISSNKQKLLMVRWIKRSYHREVHLWVFEVDFCKAWWMKVKNLGDQVLFLYRNFSMEFTVGLSEHWGSLF
jgi:hypothetical protein